MKFLIDDKFNSIFLHSNVYEGIVVFIDETGSKENDEPLRCGRVNSDCIFENWRRRQNRLEPNLGARSCPQVCSPTELRPRSGQFCPSKRDNGWFRFVRVLKSLCSPPKMKTTINSYFWTVFNFIHEVEYVELHSWFKVNLEFNFTFFSSFPISV